MADTRYTMVVAMAAASIGLYFLLRRWRYGTCAQIHCPHPRSLLLGHLGIIGAKMKQLGDPNLHHGKLIYIPCEVWLPNYLARLHVRAALAGGSMSSLFPHGSLPIELAGDYHHVTRDG